MPKQFEIFTLKNLPVPKAGMLMTPLELRDYIDFEVKRVYFAGFSEGGGSGQHCHTDEIEFFVMMNGSCTAVIDRGNGREEIPFAAPTTAMYVPKYVWHGFKDFSEGAVLLALTSTNYDPERKGYIEDYDEYLKVRDENLR
jgi:dTDP-4-dehydrorhamnose 3,5-epimerase-like enzyme